jgi:hypothetical protein
MAENTTNAPGNSGGTRAGAEDEWYDLLPVEKKLISYSLGLGIALLVVFIIYFRVLN